MTKQASISDPAGLSHGSSASDPGRPPGEGGVIAAVRPRARTEGAAEPLAPRTRRRRAQAKQVGTETSPGAADAALEQLGPAAFINRELSLLEFHRRVLEEAEDPNNPLLERVKFLAIVGSNLDEFFMVRVAALMQQIAAGVVEPSLDGMGPAEQLAAVRRTSLALMQDARRCLRDLLLPRLREAGIHILDYAELDARQRERVASYFDEMIYPVLTPLAFDPGRPFPHISNLSLNLAVIVREASGQERFARVKVPGTLPRLLPIKRSSGGARRDGTVPYRHYFVFLEQVVAHHLDALFPGLEVVEAHPFRVTRDADTDIQELEASDLLESIEKGVRQRQFGHVVRVTVTESMPPAILNLLMSELEVDAKDVYTLDAPLGLSGLMGLTAVDRHDLKYPSFVPATVPALQNIKRGPMIFEAIRREDILLHHPFDSFTPVVDFLRAAAEDPDVLAIKQTLYRVGKNAPVVDALLLARERGKQVSVLVEIKARFDEASNIEWAKRLEKEGVHVVYGLLGLKTHSKVALVVRREGDQIRRYVHLATGNYNVVTAHLYTDMGLFTVDEAIGADASDLFNYLTGYSAKTDYRKLLVAPINLRERMNALIEREMAHQRAGRHGHLIFKMNSLVDPGMIRQLYRAAHAGVRVDLIVRGICCLRPGLPGLSENLRVISVVGRFLEHSRIYYFRNGGRQQVFLGSADLMPRNIDRRVEVMFPVEDPRLVRQLHDEVLAVYLADKVKARELRADGGYARPAVRAGQGGVNAQEQFLMSRLPPEAANPSQ